MSMIRDYYEYQKNIEDKYGEKSVILMMVGSFYEMYQYKNLGKANELSPLLNIHCTRRNKNLELSETNPNMCGFPNYCLKKYIDILIQQYKYTVGIVDQIDSENSSTKLKERKLSKIYSPCIPYEYDLDDDYIDLKNRSNICMIMGIHLQKKNHLSKISMIFLSYVMIDLSLGEIYFHETSFSNKIELDKEIEKLFYEWNVQELIILEEDVNIICENTDISIHRYSSIDSKYKTLEYQQKIFSVVYNYIENEVISLLDLGKYPTIIEYLTFAFDFIYDHTPLILKKIKKPGLIKSMYKMHYDIHSYFELNILTNPNTSLREKKKEINLIDLIDKCVTKMGSRHFHHLIFTPIFDNTELNSRYDKIDYYIKNETKLHQIRNILKNVGDLEKKFRQLQLLKISENDFESFLNDIENIKPLYENEIFQQIPVFQSQYTDIHKRFDEVNTILEQYMSKYNLQKKIHNNEIILYISTKIIRQNKTIYDIFEKKEMANGISKISNDEIKLFCYELSNLEKEIKIMRNKEWKLYIEIISDQFQTHFEHLIKTIIDMDIYSNLAYIALKYNYSRPIIQNDSTVSFLECQNIRHPIIEIIQTNELYVTNDVDLQTKNGIIIYGLNSAGKSTHLRAIGLNTIMAQIGMFVPSSQFIFNPFHSVFTKIFSIDNIYKGQSTFLYELHELNHILNHSDHNTLILCDELTSGTETYSATGIMASTILACIELNSHFVMTTHLHTLEDFPEIMQNSKLEICHFLVEVDDHKKIIYNRKLQKGVGNSLYGIEIAEAIGLNSSFIKNAFDFRNRISKKKTKLSSNKRSRYNHKKIVNQCENCGSLNNLHTHHILPQKDADKRGHINHIHKNHPANLKILCESCHTIVHK